MQFITNGPEIPDELLQAHEEGRVAFFCGAGISYPAGLPGFKGLVDKIYQHNGTEPSVIEHEAYEQYRYDATLDLLERRLPGRRRAMRQALAEVLKPNLGLDGATQSHAALLRLARDRKGVLRLVTTNFDRIFHAAAEQSKQTFQAYAAPMLPIPKNSRWDGLVYLHGLLPETSDDTALNQLVVTSGDFGLAYLTERWAARFVSELFRNHVVCFVGYSINDPVLRYMMDGLAADRLLGEATPQAWALGDCEPGQEERKTIEWQAKGVQPILYPRAEGTHDHSALHQTLHAWAETYRDGVAGKVRIVVEHALARPSQSTRQDDFVGRMLWALSDPSGLPARHFAEFNPVPSLDWLFDAFAADRYGHADLARFRVPPLENADPEVRFSLIHRPAPYPLAPPMQLLAGRVAATQWDDVMNQLAQWLVRHLNDRRLVLWIAERGGQLHEQWIRQIERRLDELIQLEHDDKLPELTSIRDNAPNAIPVPMMRTLWRLLLSGRVKSHRGGGDILQWMRRLKLEGLTATLRLELRELLSPKVRLSKPFRWGDETESADEPISLRQLVDWELELATDHVHSTLSGLADPHWQTALPALLDDMQLLLRDALDLLRELGAADDLRDPSHWGLPSISPHRQNRGFREWVSLIEWLRDAWLAVLSTDGARATQVASAWFELPYPTFKRLALFAASQGNCIAPVQWVAWLLANDAWWLWAEDTRREMFRLLVLQGHQLTPALQDQLESSILAGPPRKMYKHDLSQTDWQELVEQSIWLRLAKLNNSGLALGTVGSKRLAELSSMHPTWQLAANERDEFSHWRTGTGDPDYEESQNIDIAPRKRSGLVQWLKKPQPKQRPFYESTWRDVCRTRFFHSWSTLCDLAIENVWPLERWQEALQVWREDAMVRRSWRYAAPLVWTMPDSVVKELAHGVTWWLEAASKSIHRHRVILLHMCQRVLQLLLDEDSAISAGNDEALGQPVIKAIDHPVGHVTEALINLWFKREPNDGDGLPTDINALFTQMCDVKIRRFRHGRVLLASRLVALFRVDRSWTTQHLLPRFDWTADPIEANAVWEGFLWSPRLYSPLLLALKPPFLETARRYTKLNEHAQRFAAFLTYAALEQVEGYTTEEWREAIAALPPDGLQASAKALLQALEGAADQPDEYWKSRIQPFWRNIWPQSRDLATPEIAKSLAQMCISARGQFPEALNAVFDWLRPIEYASYLIHRLNESEHCTRFPGDALRLLTAVVPHQQASNLGKLSQCLDAIAKADPTLSSDHTYQRLHTQAHMRALR